MADPQGMALPLDYQLDDYRITRVLGQGGFGITYRGHDVRLQRDVAIKEYLPRQFAERGDDLVVRPRTEADREMFEWGLTRFVDEARTLALFRHPNIVAVARFLEANGTAYLVMDYEEGDNLEAWVGRYPNGVPEQTLVGRILLPLLEGLEKVHDKGLLHRDIKPDNIFIRGDGTPVLLDFGASRAHGQGATTALTSIITAGYSPFEQYGASGRQGPWTDLYALAGTLYRVIAGSKPTDAIARQQGAEHVPASVAGAGRYSQQLLRAIDQGLALDPAARPQSAAAFRALIESADPDAGAPDPDATVVRRRDAPAAESRRVSPGRGLVALVLAVLGAGAAVGWYVLGGVDGGGSPTGIVSAPPAAVEPDPAIERAQTAGARAGSDADAGATDAVPAAGSEPDPGPAEPDVNPAPPPLDEHAILAGLEVPASVTAYRDTQIAGALLAYVSNRARFDACLAEGCADQVALMAKVQEALDGYAWERAPLAGSVQVVNPRRLQSEECPYMLDVEETVRLGELRRTQIRTYCTRNGFERDLQSAGPIQSS